MVLRSLESDFIGYNDNAFVKIDLKSAIAVEKRGNSKIQLKTIINMRRS